VGNKRARSGRIQYPEFPTGTFLQQSPLSNKIVFSMLALRIGFEKLLLTRRAFLIWGRRILPATQLLLKQVAYDCLITL
jgi:hypothetical protein